MLYACAYVFMYMMCTCMYIYTPLCLFSYCLIHIQADGVGYLSDADILGSLWTDSKVSNNSNFPTSTHMHVPNQREI